MNTLSRHALAIALSFAALPTFGQTLYNIQLNGHETLTYSGAAQIGSAGDLWNNPNWTGVNGATSTTLFSGLSVLDSTGANNSVSASLTANYNNNGGNWNSGVFNRYSGQTAGAATPGLMDLLVKSDYSGSVNVHTLSLTGLPANAALTAFFYGAGNGAGQGSTWSLAAANGGGSAGIVFDGSATGRNVTLASSEGISWESLSGTTDGSGNLTVIATGGTGSVWWQTYMNGVQIQIAAVPEPSSFALAGLGLLSVLWRKRK
jgi:hypothetical protein